MASRSWNKVELLGNLTRDPELRYTPGGAAVCTFGLATNRTYVVEGERREEVDFHRLVAWNKLAELCNQLLKKGTKVFISGRLQYREWETQDGQKRRDAEIVVEDMLVLTPRGSIDEESVEETFAESSESKSNGSAKTGNEIPKESVEETKPKVKEENEDAASQTETVSEDDLPF